MILERARTDYKSSEDDLKVWLPDGREFQARLVRNAAREELENVLETNDFVGEYIITPTYIFFEYEEDAVLFQNKFIQFEGMLYYRHETIR
jgi:hypothetical protein